MKPPFCPSALSLLHVINHFIVQPILLCVVITTAQASQLTDFKLFENEIPGKHFCAKHFYQSHLNPNQSETLQKEIHDYQKLVEQSLSYRAESINIAKQLKLKIKQNQPLSGKDLDTLNQGMLAHLSLRKSLYNIAFSHECWLKNGKLSIENRLTGIMISLSAALLLYDNYLLSITLFEEDGKLRRFLNERDSGYKIGRMELAKVTRQYYSLALRNRLKKAIKFYKKQIKKMPTDYLQTSNHAYLDLLIQQSPSYQMTLKSSPLHVLSQRFKFLTALTYDVLKKLGDDSINLFSQLFGNSVGLIETRHGKLYHQSNIEKSIRQSLKPGDILLEKTPFRLTDKFIPGHWGHVAIWVGDEASLKEMGIWSHPAVQPYHAMIWKNKGIVEALRGGVQLSSLTQFLNVDDVAIIRNKYIDKQQLAETLIRTFRQIGKAYDFNFDVETSDRIVCSELVYITHTNIKWPTENTLGRNTISPDQVASKAIKGWPLKLIKLYHQGKPVLNAKEKMLKKLMGQ